jgi:hypothetical protein
MQKMLKKLMLALVLCSLLTTGAVLAQEEASAETTAETSDNPIVPGVGTFVLFIGAGAVLLVGVTMIARNNFQGDNKSK